MWGVTVDVTYKIQTYWLNRAYTNIRILYVSYYSNFIKVYIGRHQNHYYMSTIIYNTPARYFKMGIIFGACTVAYMHDRPTA